VLSFILGRIFLSLIILIVLAPRLGSWDFPTLQRNVNAFIDDLMGLFWSLWVNPIHLEPNLHCILSWFYDLFIFVATSNEGLWNIEKCHKMGDFNISYWTYWTWKVARNWILKWMNFCNIWITRGKESVIKWHNLRFQIAKEIN
jgi:hypothetical protein